MRAVIKQTVLPYRGEPTKRQRIDLYKKNFADLHDPMMGDPDRKVRKERKPSTPWTKEDEAELMKLHGLGLSFGQIANRLNRSKGNVYTKYKELKGE